MILEPSIPYTPTKSSAPHLKVDQDKAATRIYTKIVCAKRHTDTMGRDSTVFAVKILLVLVSRNGHKIVQIRVLF